MTQAENCVVAGPMQPHDLILPGHKKAFPTSYRLKMRSSMSSVRPDARFLVASSIVMPYMDSAGASI